MLIRNFIFKVTIEDALDRTRFVANDADFSVWKMMSNGVSYARNILQFTENKEILNGYLVGLVDHYYQKMGWRTDLDTISDMDRQAMTLALGKFSKFRWVPLAPTPGGTHNSDHIVYSLTDTGQNVQKSHTRRSDASEKSEDNSVSTFGRFRLWTSLESSSVSVKMPPCRMLVENKKIQLIIS